MHILEHPLASAAGHVHVEQYHVGTALEDHLRRGAHLVRLAHDLDAVAQLGADARANQRVVVDEEDPKHPFFAHDGPVRGSTNSTSVPAP